MKPRFYGSIALGRTLRTQNCAEIPSMITPPGTGGQLHWKQGPRVRRPEVRIWLGVDSALADGVGHTINCQHVGRNSVIHAVRFRVPHDIVKRRNHDVRKTLVDL
jgi:hypothetical protein